MRKSTLFISAALTAFVLAILAGVASAYQGIAAATEVAAQVTSAPTEIQGVDPAIDPPAPTQPASVKPEEAAALAAKIMNKQDLYSVESATLNGVDAYLVTFSSGDLVYIGLDGQVLLVTKQQVTASNSVVVPPAPVKPRGGGGNTGSSHSEGEHEHIEVGDD
jgi:hypothetical protein